MDRQPGFGQRGFSLIEVLVALIAVSLLLAGTLAAFGRAAVVLAETRDRLRAGWLLPESRIELEIGALAQPTVRPETGRLACPQPFDDFVLERAWLPLDDRQIPSGTNDPSRLVLRAQLRVRKQERPHILAETVFDVVLRKEAP
jgi:prepilin-type N-terminal cleavage/methylation domain-containing protein